MDHEPSEAKRTPRSYCHRCRYASSLRGVGVVEVGDGDADGRFGEVDFGHEA